MDYPGDDFHSFLDFESVIYLAHNGTVTSLPVFILNIFNCVPKMKETLMGLEQRAGKWVLTTFSFWVGVTL